MYTLKTATRWNTDTRLTVQWSASRWVVPYPAACLPRRYLFPWSSTHGSQHWLKSLLKLYWTHKPLHTCTMCILRIHHKDRTMPHSNAWALSCYCVGISAGQFGRGQRRFDSPEFRFDSIQFTVVTSVGHLLIRRYTIPYHIRLIM